MLQPGDASTSEQHARFIYAVYRISISINHKLVLMCLAAWLLEGYYIYEAN
jgi:hypothetical protein